VSAVTAVLIAVGACAATYVGTRVIRAGALRRRLLDIPNQRSLHLQPTPRGAGVALVLVVVAGASIAMLLSAVASRPVLSMLAGAVVVAAAGLADDLRGVSAMKRLAVHVAAAVALIGVVGPIAPESFALRGGVAVYGLAAVLTLWWVVGLTNAYNFMDGIDGIAGGQAVVAGLAWAVIGVLAGDAAIAMLGLLVGAASLGFLFQNWSPAKIFLGDVGSVFLGYIFASLTVIASQLTPALALAGVLVVWPFVFDSGLTLLRRVRRREPLMTAHRSHLYQRLVIAGASHNRVAALYTGMAIVCAFCAIHVTAAPDGSLVRAPAVMTGTAVTLWSLTLARERVDRQRKAVLASRDFV
jgi:UDP-N-acetylmuramyl pentapeptide phosphotransferase/UDP-N-acetylglucosamine-1-phosphate transferase